MVDNHIGIYFHWPFCASKCPYCDFNVHIQDDINQQTWLEAYLRSIEYYAELMNGRQVRSIFFGGGTPSLMEPQLVEKIIEKVRASWNCVNDFEITLEANPTSVEMNKFQAFKESGVNRVSLGVQALNDEDLKFLGRTHDVAHALAAIEVASSLFDRFSFDLIYARPEQSLEDWEKELKIAVSLRASHLSLYQLTIERNTPFYFSHEQGQFSVPEEGLAADFYTLTGEVLSGYGLPAYEVSNYAKAGHESQHNLIYWRYDDYIGIGPGAHGRLTLPDESKVATREHHAPDIWLKHVEEKGSGMHPSKILSAKDQFLEEIMMGLRLREGVPLERIERRTGLVTKDLIDFKRVELLAQHGDFMGNVKSTGRLVLSDKGRLRLNAIVPYILK